MALPHHRPYGHLHVDGSHSGLCGAVFCLRRQHGIWEASEVTSFTQTTAACCASQGEPRQAEPSERRNNDVTVYWKLDPGKVYSSSPNAWDTAVHDASEEYKHRMHNLCCDNCHSHVALALNLMRYDNSTSWNMVKLCFFSLLYGKYVSIGGFVKTWLPFVLFLGAILTVVLTLHLR
uniref:Transmembrane protein 222 n=1 Tax=Gallus gallus TaxID=9031 RepID=A0A8V0YZH1_CHICK